jgi:transmembrane sensor
MPADHKKALATSVLDDAIAWHTRLRDRVATPSVLVEFRAWKDAAPEHATAYNQAQQFWDALDQAKPQVLEHFSEELGQALSSDPVIEPWYERFGLYLDRFRFNVSHIRMAAVGASIVLAVVVLSLNVPFQGQPVAYATNKGEIKQIQLQDGSSLLLNADTKIKVQYRRRARDLELLQGGAIFDVARNNKRPFVIRAADSTVTVLGTRFEVDLTPDNIKVAVARGLVEVAQKSTLGTRQRFSLLLKPGEQINHEIGQVKFTRSKIDPSQIGTWKDHVLIFENDTLADSVRRLNRHFTQGEIKLGDVYIGQRRLSGVFKAISPDATAEQLAQLLSLNVRQTDGSSTLEAKQAGP